MSRSQGLLLSFEGIDASGKRTQSLMLFKWLRSIGMRTEYLSFPDYNTIIGGEIRAFLSGKKTYSLEARHMLYSVNRYEHKEQIEDWLRDRRIIVVNRYCESNIAYGTAAGLSLEWLEELEGRMPKSDYVFFLDVTPDVSKDRKPKRDKFEADSEYLARVSSVYRALSERRNWFKVDAANTIDTLHYEVKSITQHLLKENKLSDGGLPVSSRGV